MIALRCPECNSQYDAPDELAGSSISCPSCGARIFVSEPPSAQIIDVRAVALNEPEPQKEPDFESDPFFNPDYQRPPTNAAWGQTIRIHRTGDGSGCCLFGCLGIFFLAFLVFRGLASLF